MEIIIREIQSKFQFRLKSKAKSEKKNPQQHIYTTGLIILITIRFCLFKMYIIAGRIIFCTTLCVCVWKKIKKK